MFFSKLLTLEGFSLKGSRLVIYASVAALIVLLSILVVAFSTWTATSAWSFPLFLVASVFLIYLPGKMLLDISRPSLTPLEDLTLALILGMTSSSILYWAAASLSAPALFILWPAVATAMYLLYRKGRWPELRSLSFSPDAAHLLLIGLIALAILPMFFSPMYYRDFSLLPQGAMTFSGSSYGIFHVSIANELTHTVPPQVPTYAGAPLRYHYGMDLLVAMFSRIVGLNTMDLTVRFMPTLHVTVALLAVFCVSRAWFSSGYAAVLTAFLVFFGEDLAFIPGLLDQSHRAWAAEYFSVPTIISLYALNPMLPALGILFGGLLCLVKYHQEQGRSYLLLTGFLFAALLNFKVFALAQVLASLAIAGLVFYTLRRDVQLLKVFGATAIMTALLAIPSWFSTDVAGIQWVRIEPWSYIATAITRVGLANTFFGRHIIDLYQHGQVTPTALAALLLLALPIYLLGAFGLRSIGLVTVLRETFWPKSSTPLRYFLAVFALLGPLITLTWAVTPKDYPGAYNNAVWFFVQSKYVVWIFAVETLMTFLRSRRRSLQVLVPITVMALSIPSTLQFFYPIYSKKPAVLGEHVTDMANFLARTCSSGEVVMSSGKISVIIAAMTRCRVLSGPFGKSLMGKTELTRRENDNKSFWEAWGQSQLALKILRRYNVAYIVSDRSPGSNPPRIPVGQRTFQLVYENPDLAVYKVNLTG